MTVRNAAYEQALDAQGVSYRYIERLELKAIDVKGGLRNQARLAEPLSDELRKQYAEMFRKGAQAPPLVVKKKKNQSVWVPLDGNHRIAAAQDAGIKFLDAYEVDCNDPMVLDRITWSFNDLVNGKRLLPEEALEHALTMVRKYDMDMKAAANVWNIDWKKIHRRLTADKCRDVLERNSAPNTAKRLTEAKLIQLSPLAALGEDVFTLLACTVDRCGLTENDIDEVRADIKRAPTHFEKVRVITDLETTPKVKQRAAETMGGTLHPKRYGPLPAERLHRLLTEVQEVLTGFDKSVLRAANGKSRSLRETAAEVADGLVLLFGLGARPKKEATSP